MFDDIVERYDRVNVLLSFGLDRRWRVATAEAVAAVRGDTVLDLGTGTGDLGIVVSRTGADVVGVDLSHEMLTAASAKAGSRLSLVEGNAYALPFPDGTFQGVVSGFVLRNLDDLTSAFSEMARVLAPGGRVALVDITEPRHPVLRRAFDAYFRLAAPALGRMFGKAEAYRYLVRSLAQLPPPDEVCAHLLAAGLERASARPLTGGIVTLFTAERPEGDRAG
jgi:demethylmenaquinone methyltransferase / 2-methoxy-6-polyprenyl-1,4-benzoquinol methylase